MFRRIFSCFPTLGNIQLWEQNSRHRKQTSLETFFQADQVRFLLPEQLLPTLNRKDGLQIDQKKPESSRIKPAMFHRVDQY